MPLKGVIDEIMNCKDEREKDELIEELNDKFQYGVYQLDELKEAVKVLLQHCVKEKDRVIRESILNAVGNALNNCDIGDTIDFAYIVDHIDSFSVSNQSYIVGFLGYSYDERYIQYLKDFNTNDETLKEAIDEALYELKHRIKQKK